MEVIFLKSVPMLCKWVLVIGGFLLAYQGLTGVDLVMTTFGGLSQTVSIVVFGGAALVVAYHLLTMKHKK